MALDVIAQGQVGRINAGADLGRKITFLRQENAVPKAPLRGHPGHTIVARETKTEEAVMTWTTPTLVEICIGLEINGYLPAEF